ncbi:MAG: PQQ-binding-like beta-propeller repeat protein [Pseudomonadota bacterium]|nr:PQQ-binding-like beta-propeller repeat protein [Pseudomonadota bacterium]
MPLPAALAADGDWTQHGRTLDNQRYSPLHRVTVANVAGLQPRWTWHSGVNATFQTTPIVRDGVMYVSLPFSGVAALDAASGRELWKYSHTSRWKGLCCGPANRGVAVAGGKVYIGTVDGRLLALDARTGAVLWDVAVAEQSGSTESSASLAQDDPLGKVGRTGSTGIGISMAPIVFQGKVFVAVNGVGYGLHPDQGLAVVGISQTRSQSGFMAAYDAATGARLWKWDVTGPGWEGTFRNSTGDGVPMHRDIDGERNALAQYQDAWRYGGGSIYASPVVDARRHLLIFGTGNPSPQMADSTRPGDNLHTSSLVALDLRDGRLVWAYQQVPHDRWGYDVATPPVLLDLRWQGRTVPAVAEASKLGWVYVHDRRDGTLLFKSEAFVPQSNMLSPPTTGEGVVIAPGIAGGSNWSPTAYDPAHGLLFVDALHLPTRYILHQETDKDGHAFTYVSTQNVEEHAGTLTAIDLRHGGRIAWQERTADPLVGGTLATAGGLVFTGIGEQKFAAFDAVKGGRLWEASLDAGVNAPPVSYLAHGEQLVAVAVGGNSLFGFKTGDSVAAFALPAAAASKPRAH